RVRADHRDGERVPADARRERGEVGRGAGEAPAREELAALALAERVEADREEARALPRGEIGELEARRHEHAREAARGGGEEAAQRGVLDAPERGTGGARALDELEPVEDEDVRAPAERALERVEALARLRGRRVGRDVGERLIEEGLDARVV